MTTFDERERGFEAHFAHDEELEFKAAARRDRLLGLWAADRMGLTGEEAQNYALEVMRADLKEPGDQDVLRKVSADLDKKGVGLSDAELQLRMDTLLEASRAEIKAS